MHIAPQSRVELSKIMTLTNNRQGTARAKGREASDAAVLVYRVGVACSLGYGLRYELSYLYLSLELYL